MSFIQVTCPCGRTLRAKEEMAGASIKCWSCHKEVAVPHPRIAGRLARQFSEQTRAVTTADSIFPIFGAALAVSLILTIPVAGPWLAFLVAIGAALLYCESIRRAGMHRSDELAPWSRAEWARRLPMAVVAALGLMAPILLLSLGVESLGLRGWWGLAVVAVVTAVGWVVIPLALFAVSAHDASGPLAPERALDLVRRYPMAVLPALLLVPLGLIVLEFATIAVLYQQGWFNYMVVDVLPYNYRIVDPFLPRRGYLYVDVFTVPETAFFKSYAYALSHRGTFIAGIPASLTQGFYRELHPSVTLSDEWAYLAVRVTLSTLILTVLGVLLAIQARWLGLIPTLEETPRAERRAVGVLGQGAGG